MRSVSVCVLLSVPVSRRLCDAVTYDRAALNGPWHKSQKGK